MKLTVLGCGDAFGNGGRNNTAFLLTSDSEHVLVDCGATTLKQLKSEGINLDDISTVIISHFHGDHYGGIPFLLISCLFESERKLPLSIVGPSGVKSKVELLLECMYPETSEKLSHLDLTFYEYASETLTIGNKLISAWEVEHSPPSKPHAIRLEWEGKVFAFSGDTSWSENLIPASDAADLFICECNFSNYQAFGHLSYTELLAKKHTLNCNNIWLTHMGTEVLELDDVVFNRLADGMKIEF